MPTYQYACNSCGEKLEVVQKFSDDALTVCPACQGELRKVFSAVGIVFKGSGFYRTDNRASSASTTATTTPSKTETKTETKTSTESSAAPAAASTTS